MTNEEIAEIAKQIEKDFSKDYFLIRRDAWWRFVGGALAFTLACGYVSYQSALTALTYPEIKKAKDSVIKAARESQEALIVVTTNTEATRNKILEPYKIVPVYRGERLVAGLDTEVFSLNPEEVSNASSQSNGWHYEGIKFWALTRK